MLYSAYYHNDDPESFITTLHDFLHERLSIDMIRLNGPDFVDWDNRILTLNLVRYNLTEVAMFDQTGQPIHPSEFLYKKSLMVVRGNFRPPTLVTEDVFHKAFQMFQDEDEVDASRSEIIAELTLENLSKNG